MPRSIPRQTFGLAALVLVVGLMAFNTIPAAAASTIFSVSGSIDVLDEVDSYSVALEAGMQIQVEAICGAPATLDPMVILYDPEDFLVMADDDSGPVRCDGWWSSIFTYTVPVAGTYWLDVASAFGNTGPYTLTVTVVDGPGADFSGPALPGPEGRNLVLFTSDTAVLSAANGTPTGGVMKACQTAFVIATSEDGAFGRLFVMGGWVPLANTFDVPEDYGQDTASIASDCVGVLPYPPVPAPTPNHVPLWFRFGILT